MLANLESGMDEMFAGMRERLGMEPKAAASNFEEDDGKVNELSHELDVDTLNANFQKYAGLDDTLSRAEYDKFVKEEKIPPSTAGILWSLLDRDNSGEVSKDEFHSALLALQQNRSWARYCPSCEYRNDCAFCQECNSGCPHRRLRQTRPGLWPLLRVCASPGVAPTHRGCLRVQPLSLRLHSRRTHPPPA